MTLSTDTSWHCGWKSLKILAFSLCDRWPRGAMPGAGLPVDCLQYMIGHGSRAAHDKTSVIHRLSDCVSYQVVAIGEVLGLRRTTSS